MLLIDKNSDKFFAKNYCGGKGHNLYKLSNEGFNVPSWFVIPPHFFENYKIENEIDQKIALILESKEDNKTKELSIKNTILSANYSLEMTKELLKRREALKSEYIAVRSSALDEDGGAHSFAGMLESALYIKDDDFFLKAIKNCWASAYSERSLSYRSENKLSTTNIAISLVVQEMINPDISGVAFSTNPINQKASESIINAVYGVGEGLVSGLYEPDNFVINKEDNTVISSEIASKEKMLVQDFENQCPKEVDVEINAQNNPTLKDKHIKELSKLIKKIELFYKYPQDIEWAIYKDEIFILQSRPITTEVENPMGHLYIWDNSNIVESYGGITKPLTFGFAHYVYHQVYVQFCEVLMVPKSQIKKMDYFLKNMLGHMRGRVYYNLLNWYKLTSILPGYKYNRSFMETMMGTNSALEDEIAQRTRPPAFQNTFSGKLRKILTGFKFFYFHLNIQNIVDNFLSYFYKEYDYFKAIDFETMSSDEIYLKYQELEEKMLWKWHAPIINDFLCMVHFGLFKKLTDKWLSHLGDNFHNDLLAGNGNLESALPTKELIRLAGVASKTEGLVIFLKTYDNDSLIEALRQSDFQDFYQEVVTYIDKYGFRCMSEMKLEQKDLYQNPGLFFTFLKNIINSGQTDLEEFEQREKAIRVKAEELLQNNIQGYKEKIYRWSLKHARKAVMNRENTRFCRTRVYGIVRRMFFAMGEDFTRRNVIKCPEDIFYLALFELKGALEGTLNITNLKAIIETRKSEYQEFEKEDDPLSRFHTRGPVYWNNTFFAKEEIVIDREGLKENELAGLGCCPGIIEGTARLVNGPDDDLNLNGEILITKRTDPGWIPLYPSISALLVERGGLLSHSAIVAREMGLPTIVSIEGLTKKIKTGMKLRIDGEKGLIEILEENE
ncbi:phosphoenolpyruvate synthase [Halobacteriovorax sp. GB3]|uniref:phosphoenolpyruvate synthase n=1 Tax=Halobacteriovorax sp. GB3 TaxID=2719615 RepID=UPI00235E7016|nr:phosphoenolpyruvate synthase [Halobacteriovorax sp. GB3]MDD0852842.1 phosphoenolpyruvate synthase [Halobacteriovorax sp. GB3]